MNILQAGDKAPKFTLQNQADEPVSLSICRQKSTGLFLSESSYTRLHYASVRTA